MYEGTPKEAIDIYKKVLVDQFHRGTGTADASDVPGDGPREEDSGTGQERWKDHFPVNPSLVEYGEKNAEIIDFPNHSHNDLFFDEHQVPIFLKLMLQKT